MKHHSEKFRQFLLSKWVLAVFVLSCGVASFFYFTNRAEEQALDRIAVNAKEVLEQQTDTVLRQLEKHRYLPKLLSKHPTITSFMESNASFGRERVAGHLLEAVSYSGAIDAAIADTSGDLIVSANAFLSSGVVAGGELQVAAMQGRLGRASISNSEGRRGYAFSAPIRSGNRIIGIVIVVSPLEGIERSWALSSYPIFAFNEAGEMVAGNLLARDRDLPLDAIRMRYVRDQSSLPPGEIFDGQALFHRTIPHLNLDLHMLVPQASVLVAGRNAGVISLLATALTGLLLLFLQWRVRLQDRQRRDERATALRLERRVRDRTRELTLANEKLAREIAERRQAQANLVKAQSELVQAEKLAAIGQMSATLAHEYNQPLAAIRGYSDNAKRFLERDEKDRAFANLDRITGLVDRLATLSKRLLAFARKPEPGRSSADLTRTLKDAALIVDHKARQKGVRIRLPEIKEPIAIAGDELRLSQVFVNLLSNAVDACDGSAKKRVSINVAKETSGLVRIDVKDTGSGFPKELADRIFDPFFTTKEVGDGIGLGLSIVYNTVRDFGGRVTAENDPSGGAVMRVWLNSVAAEKTRHDKRKASPLAKEVAE